MLHARAELVAVDRDALELSAGLSTGKCDLDHYRSVQSAHIQGGRDRGSHRREDHGSERIPMGRQAPRHERTTALHEWSICRAHTINRAGSDQLIAPGGRYDRGEPGTHARVDQLHGRGRCRGEYRVSTENQDGGVCHVWAQQQRCRA